MKNNNEIIKYNGEYEKLFVIAGLLHGAAVESLKFIQKEWGEDINGNDPITASHEIQMLLNMAIKNYEKDN